MQIKNITSSQNNTNSSFRALRISPKALEELEYMGNLTKQYYEKIWQKIATHIEDTKFYDVVINEKLRPVFVEKATGTELRNIRLRSASLDNIEVSADICNKTNRISNSYLILPLSEFFNFKTEKNKLIEDCNDIIKMTKVLEAYKKGITS